MLQALPRTRRIGIFVPFTNTNLEADMAMMCPNGVSMHFMRLGGYDIDEVPDAGQMSQLARFDMDDAIRLLAGVRPEVVLYGCTSATLALGADFDSDLASKIKEKSGAACITAASALVQALETLAVRNIAFASPYVASLNDDAIGFLESQEFNVVSRFDYPIELGNYGQGELHPKEISKFALESDSTEAEAIVLSCTDMRAAETIKAIESQTNKPVVTSNQALLFCALKNLQINETFVDFGQLFNHL